MYYQLWHKIMIEIRIETITSYHNKIYQILLFGRQHFSNYPNVFFDLFI